VVVCWGRKAYIRPELGPWTFNDSAFIPASIWHDTIMSTNFWEDNDILYLRDGLSEKRINIVLARLPPSPDYEPIWYQLYWSALIATILWLSSLIAEPANWPLYIFIWSCTLVPAPFLACWEGYHHGWSRYNVMEFVGSCLALSLFWSAALVRHRRDRRARSTFFSWLG
jgi:hypothetical protein